MHDGPARNAGQYDDQYFDLANLLEVNLRVGFPLFAV
jgi:hypothetical protein